MKLVSHEEALKISAEVKEIVQSAIHDAEKTTGMTFAEFMGIEQEKRERYMEEQVPRKLSLQEIHKIEERKNFLAELSDYDLTPDTYQQQLDFTLAKLSWWKRFKYKYFWSHFYEKWRIIYKESYKHPETLELATYLQDNVLSYSGIIECGDWKEWELEST